MYVRDVKTAVTNVCGLSYRRCTYGTLKLLSLTCVDCLAEDVRDVKTAVTNVNGLSNRRCTYGTLKLLSLTFVDWLTKDVVDWALNNYYL